MKRTLICVSIFLGAMALCTSSAHGEECSSSIGCDACAQLPGSIFLECVKIHRDSSCWCCEFSDGSGCLLGGACDYTGPGGQPCDLHGTCPDIRNSAIGKTPKENETQPDITSPTDPAGAMAEHWDTQNGPESSEQGEGEKQPKAERIEDRD